MIFLVIPPHFQQQDAVHIVRRTVDLLAGVLAQLVEAGFGGIVAFAPCGFFRFGFPPLLHFFYLPYRIKQPGHSQPGQKY